jgi:hypothetical protein
MCMSAHVCILNQYACVSRNKAQKHGNAHQYAICMVYTYIHTYVLEGNALFVIQLLDYIICRVCVHIHVNMCVRVYALLLQHIEGGKARHLHQGGSVLGHGAEVAYGACSLLLHLEILYLHSHTVTVRITATVKIRITVTVTIKIRIMVTVTVTGPCT